MVVAPPTAAAVARALWTTGEWSIDLAETGEFGSEPGVLAVSTLEVLDGREVAWWLAWRKTSG